MKLYRDESFEVGWMSFDFKNKLESESPNGKPDKGYEKLSKFELILSLFQLTVIGGAIFLSIQFLLLDVIWKFIIGGTAGILISSVLQIATEKSDKKLSVLGWILSILSQLIIVVSVFLSIKILSISIILKCLIGGIIGFLISAIIELAIEKITGKSIDTLWYKRTFSSGEKEPEHKEETRKDTSLQKGTLIGKGRKVNYIIIDNDGTHYKQISPEKNDAPKSSNVHIPYVDSSYTMGITLNDMVYDIKTRMSGVLIWNKMLFLSILAAIVLVVFKIVPITIYFWGIMGGIILLLGLASGYDRKRKTAYMVYDIAHSREESIQNFYDAFFKLAESKKLWSVTGTQRIRDAKRNAGATASISRDAIQIGDTPGERIKTNIFVPSISENYEDFYFFPDMILYVNNGKPCAVSYSDIEVTVSTAQFRERESIPSDAEVIGYTWQYVNKDGSPDRRFNDNHRVSLVKYGAVKINIPGKTILDIMISNYSKCVDFGNALRTYQLHTT